MTSQWRADAVKGALAAGLPSELADNHNVISAWLAQVERAASVVQGPLADAWGRAVAKAWLAGDARPTQLSDARWHELAWVCACLAGDTLALVEIERRLAAAVAEQGLRSRHGADMVNEAGQRLREKLLVGTSGANGRLAQFGARGSLDGFLRTALAREVASLVRSRARETPLEDDAVPGGANTSAELELLKRAYGPLASAAFKDAFALLPADQQTLLHQVYAHGMTVDDLARVHGVHRATCARRVARARTALGDTTRTLLQQRLGLAQHDADSVMRVLQSNLSVSLGWSQER